MELFDWKLSTILMRLAGEINTRKNIYTKKVISAKLCLSRMPIIFSAEAQCVHICVTDFKHIMKISVTVIVPRQVSVV